MIDRKTNRPIKPPFNGNKGKLKYKYQKSVKKYFMLKTFKKDIHPFDPPLTLVKQNFV